MQTKGAGLFSALEGSELVFTPIRQPGMSDQQFAEDKATVENDLRR